jgi:hypothetical protein
MNVASVRVFVLLMHLIWWALDFALASAGKSMPARIAMMAMTTSNSIRVNPERRRPEIWSFFINNKDLSST